MIPTLALAALAAVATSAGWVFRDACARGLPARKAATWAALQPVQWPLFLWLYRRARPRGLGPGGAGRGGPQPQVP